MKLLVYGDIEGSGGYTRYCKGLFGSNAIPDDMEVWFVCSSSFFEKLKPLDQQIHIITHTWPDSKSRIKRYLWHLWLFPRLVRSIKPDIEFYPSGQRRVYLRKALTISTCHNLLLFDLKELACIENKEKQRFFRGYGKKQARSFVRSNGVIFLSEHARELVCKEITGIRQTTVIAHGLDSTFLLTRKRFYELSNRINLLYVSPIYHYKHQIEVVKAVKKLRDLFGLDIRIRLVGNGDSLAVIQLMQLIQSETAESYVCLLGSVNYRDLFEEYRAADIFVFASSCETFGITLLEAMGMRLPIACSNRTGLPEILRDAGVYFDPECPDSIIEALQKLLLNEELRKACGEQAYHYALNYTWERCASKTMAFIKQIIGANSPCF